jgi:hypothetical protein
MNFGVKSRLAAGSADVPVRTERVANGFLLSNKWLRFAMRTERPRSQQHGPLDLTLK